MSNEKLIGQAREAIDNMEDFARMADVVAAGPLLVLNRSVDALEAADKRIAEEREQHDIMMERGAEKLAEAERKLSVAREALIQLANAADNQGAFTGMSWQQAKAVCTAALAQIAATEQK